MEILVLVLYLVHKFGLVSCEFCFNTFYGYSYCSGYCDGYYGSEYCVYDYYIGSFTVAAFAGIIVGSVIFLGIFIAVIVAICASCTKSAGQRGRLIHPISTTSGISTVQSNGHVVQQHYNYATPTAPPVYTNMAYYSAYPPAAPPQPMNEPMPPPIYAEANSQVQQPYANNGEGTSTKQ
ncbi:unnamed protein product [Mytilus coruscus]|uniref:Cysteine and tyrosine-rich protein 1 n=1 Tax=Mytilus coruscus TaxID=42192 RepID=A0A6J8AHB1_MYTCO|nr:unnamed protein product [Mytilus coruscus]